MKTRIFVVLLLLCLNFSTILTANASKYYYESYEQSEMYADAIVNDDNEVGKIDSNIDIGQSQLENNNSGSGIVVGEDKINITDANRINYNIRIKTRKSKKTSNKQEKTTKLTSKKVKKLQQTEEVVVNKKRKKRVTKKKKSNTTKNNDRLNIYLSAGLSGFVTSKYETNTGDIRSSVSRSITDISSLKQIIKSGVPYLFDFSIGTKFYFLKKGTGPFLCFDFFFKYLISASFSSTVVNSVEGVTFNTGVITGGNNPSTTTPSKVYNSEYKNVLKSMIGFSFKGGFSIDRVSFYGKINLGKLQVSNYIILPQESISDMKNDINKEEGSATKQELSEKQSLLQNSERNTNWVTTYGVGFGMDVNITKRFFLKLEYDHWWFKNKWITDEYTNSNGTKEFISEGNFGVVTLGIGIKFLGFSF